MSIVPNPAVSGTVLDARPGILVHNESLQSGLSALSAEVVAQAASSDEASTALVQGLHHIHSGATADIVSLQCAQTVATAYAVRLCDMRAKANGLERATGDMIQATLAAVTEKEGKTWSAGRVSQLRNAAKVLVDLEFPLSDPDVGNWLNASGISKPLTKALETKAERGVEAARTVFRNEMAVEVARVAAVKAKREADQKALEELRESQTASAGGADTTSREAAPAGGTVPTGLSVEARWDRMVAELAAMPLSTPEEVAMMLELQHAIGLRLAGVDADALSAGKALADARIARTEAETAKLRTPKPRAPRKATTPKPRAPRKAAATAAATGETTAAATGEAA